MPENTFHKYAFKLLRFHIAPNLITSKIEKNLRASKLDRDVLMFFVVALQVTKHVFSFLSALPKHFCIKISIKCAEFLYFAFVQQFHRKI